MPINLPHLMRSACILIVDDMEINRVMIEKMLRGRGFTNLMLASNGREALEQAEQHFPDMIILDIQMPVMDGFECCARFRANPRYADTPILMQTMLTEPHLRYQAFMQGATDIVSKPIDANELYARIVVHLEKQYCVRQLRQYFDRTSAELEQARALQMATLPDTRTLEDIRQQHQLDVAAHFRPSSELGGDFWGIKEIFPHQLAFWIVDFSGHGVSAAINVFRLQAYLKEYSAQAGRPGEYLTTLNEKLLHLLGDGQFATMFYGVLDFQSQRLHYACSGSPHPLVLHANGEDTMIDATGFPLGLGMHSYPTLHTDFLPGDRLFLYSDALTETPNAEGVFTSEAALLTCIAARRGATSEALIQHVLSQMIDAASTPITDDLTLCAMHWKTQP